MVQWLDELKREYPWLYLDQIADRPLLDYCSPSAGTELRLRVLADLLGDEGGIYVGASTWILNFPPSFRSETIPVTYAIEQRRKRFRLEIASEKLRKTVNV